MAFEDVISPFEFYAVNISHYKVLDKGIVGFVVVHINLLVLIQFPDFIIVFLAAPVIGAIAFRDFAMCFFSGLFEKGN
jgi:hypothetical protein